MEHIGNRKVRSRLSNAATAGCLLLAPPGFGAVLRVADGEDLGARVAAAKGGDTVLVGAGTYGGFAIQNRVFTEGAPLVIKAEPGAAPLVRGSQWYLLPISNSSFIVLDGLVLEGGGQPLYLTDVDHLILANLEVRQCGQEAIHIRGSSRYVDVVNCHIHHTGSAQPQWAEGIYVGSGSQPYMNNEHIWIEGCDIHHTGNSEGINVKPRSFHVTIRNNRVHEIQPGTASQYNQAAISLEAADLDFQPGRERDIWIEGNEVYNVSRGRWANGIQVSTMGPKVKDNYVHGCEEHCLYFNDFLHGPGSFQTVLYRNRMDSCGAGERNTTSLPHVERDPGENPNRPQSWYRSPTAVRPGPGIGIASRLRRDGPAHDALGRLFRQTGAHPRLIVTFSRDPARRGVWIGRPR